MTSEGESGWIPAIDAEGLQEAKAVRVEVAETPVLVVRSPDDSIMAVAARCTHQGAPLDRGVLNLRDLDPTVTWTRLPTGSGLRGTRERRHGRGAATPVRHARQLRRVPA